MNKIEKISYNYLKEQGYLVEKVIRTQWHRIDFFNLFDFIAVKPEWIRFIQVSVKYFSSRDKGWQKRFLEFPLATGVTKEYWRVEKKLPKIHILAYNRKGKKKEWVEFYKLPR